MENFEVVYFPWAEAEILKGDYPLGGAGGGGGGGGGGSVSHIGNLVLISPKIPLIFFLWSLFLCNYPEI